MSLSRFVSLIGLVSCLLLTGCGNKGPLVLPDKTAAPSKSTPDSANKPAH